REAAWRSRTDANPADDMQETSVTLAWLLAKVTLIEPVLPKVLQPETSDLQPLQDQADELARAAANWNPNIDSATSMVRALAQADSEFSVGKDRGIKEVSYRARRLVLAVDRLCHALNRN